jgi:hypothetical protein
MERPDDARLDGLRQGHLEGLGHAAALAKEDTLQQAGHGLVHAHWTAP